VQPDTSREPTDLSSAEAGGLEEEPDLLAELDGIADVPLADQVEVYHRVHRELQQTLGEIDTA
jgi:hypothetical protein